MEKKELVQIPQAPRIAQPGSEPASSSDINKTKPRGGTDSHGEEAKMLSNTDDAKDLYKGHAEVKPRALWQIKLEAFLDCSTVQIFMTILTIFALFADDVRMLGFTKTADQTFYGLLSVSMGLFFLEIFLASICKEDYFNSFFFWLDIISTASLVGDIAWIVPESSAAGQATDVAKQARAGRAARVIRLIRLIRLIRITKLYKEVQQRREEKEVEATGKQSAKIVPLDSVVQGTPEETAKSLFAPRITDSPPQTSMPAIKSPEKQSSTAQHDGPKESKVSKLLSDLTTQRVVVLIITLTFCLPMLDLASYTDPPHVPVYAVQALADAHKTMTPVEFKKLCDTFSNKEKEDKYYPLVYISGPDCGPYYFGSSVDGLRESEKIIGEQGGYSIVADMRAQTKLNAGLSIGRTIFLCILLAAGAILFSHHTTTLVLYPLESMMEKANLLAKDPMAFCLATDDEDLGIYSMQAKMENKGENYETQYLESLIVKIAKLLAVEFGEAGTKIIAANLSNNDFLNPMIPGSKMCGVFGFIIINSFAETTEALQTDIMLYLNQIAETVHATIDKYLGATNKNIGEAFLVLWKFPENDVEMTPTGPIAKTNLATTIVDLALFAYIKIIAKINKLQHILKFADEIRKKLPHFKLKMGFGLHVGWGIEGAIGSIHKIDASYLSPNVNISARLEAATKQFGVPLLVSGQVFNMLSPAVKSYCREIDIVAVKGSVLPIKLYTVDIDLQALKPKDCRYANIEPGRKKDKRLEKRKRFHKKVKNESITSQTIYRTDKDLDLMRAGINQGFIKQHQEGYTNYIAGNWNQAVENFKKALVLRPNDGPTVTLLSYMEGHNGIAPPTWKGYRILTEK